MLNRPFLVLYATMFVATLGISMVSPLLPVYAEDLGATGIWIGVTFSSFAVAQTLFGPFAGQLSDKYGRRPFIIVGLLIYCGAAAGYLTATSFYQVILFRAVSGLGTSLIFSVARAYVGDMIPPGQEGRWFGAFATSDVIGFGVGPLIAGLVREWFGFDAVFVCMGGLLAGAAMVVWLGLPRQEAPGRAATVHRGGTTSFSAALHDRLVLGLTLNMALMSVAWGAGLSFLAVLLEDEIGVGPAMIGVAFGLQSLSSGAAQPFLGRIADRFNRRLLVFAGLTAGGLALGGIGLAETFAVVLALQVAQGTLGAVSNVANSAMQVIAGRRAGMGTVIGLGSAGNGIGIVLGSVLGGLMVDWYSLDAAFFFGGAVMVAGAWLFMAVTRGVATSEAELMRREQEATAVSAAA